tara:strand:- start:86 stop:550 length:465 start_codon:yes stop_codon:yes gene_type:complete
MKQSADGFTLVEVVVAVGVFVAGVVAAVALLSQTTSSASTRLEAAAAERVMASSKALLSTETWDRVLNRITAEETWHANREGSRIDIVETVPAADQFYAVRLRRDEVLFPIGSEDESAAAALWIEVRWPKQDGSGNEVRAENQDVLRSRWVLLR